MYRTKRGSYADDPAEFFYEGLNGAKVPLSKESLGRVPKPPRPERLKGVIKGDPDVVEDARIPVAVGQALGTVAPDRLSASRSLLLYGCQRILTDRLSMLPRSSPAWRSCAHASSAPPPPRSGRGVARSVSSRLGSSICRSRAPAR